MPYEVSNWIFTDRRKKFIVEGLQQLPIEIVVDLVDLVLNELYRVLQEVNLQREIKQEIEKVVEKLEATKAFIFPNPQEEINPEYQSWLSDRNGVALEIEAVLDEFFHSIAHHNTHRCSIFPCVRKRMTKQEICSKLRSLEARVYKPPKILGSSSAMARTEVIEQVRRNALWVDESHLVGMDEKKNMLVTMLVDDLYFEVLAIIAPRGQGKTTLAKQIYRDNVLISQFKKRAFVTVSRSLTEDKLLKDIFEQLFPDEMRMQQLPVDLLKERVRERLQNEKYLIVLDDVRNVDHLFQLKQALPTNNSCGGKVVITTCDSKVASSSGGKVYDLQPLSERDSWILFCKKTFSGEDCPDYLNPICSQIIALCDGNPLAILTSGGLSATKVKDKDNVKVLYQKVLSQIAEDIENIKQAGPSLSISLTCLNDLPRKLISCYMLLSVFPKDYVINCKRLIRLWMSGSFLKEDGRTLEEIGYSYIEELINRGLIQVAQMKADGRVKSCRIHNSLRELVFSMSMAHGIVESFDRDTGTWESEKVELFPHRLDEKSKIEMLLFHATDQIQSTVYLFRSLFLFEEDDSLYSRSKMSKLPIDRFKFLKVLDLTGAPLLSFPEEISTLLLLRHLSLRNTKISKIPKSIRTLQRLETLDLKQTDVTELPSEISLLQRLRNLLIRRYTVTFGLSDHKVVKITRMEGGRAYFTLLDVGCLKVTPHIGGLLSLQKLCFLEVSANVDSIKVLGRLTQLTKLCLVNLKEQHWNELGSSISKMTNLRSMTLHTDGSFNLQYISSPPPFLQRLHLTGQLDELPRWMCSLLNLQVLHLMFSKLKKDPTKCLKGLPNLVLLVLYKALDGVKTYSLPDSFSPIEAVGHGRQEEMIIGVRNGNF